MASESGSVDPMHQFMVEPLFGQGWQVAGQNIAFTNSALWMAITLVAVWAFMFGGMKRELVPGRWQMAVETVTGAISGLVDQSIGPKGRAFLPYIFTLFMFILVANLLGMMPTAFTGLHAFTLTSHLTVTGVLALLSFGIVLAVGFWKHGLHFLSLFVPAGVPWYIAAFLFPIELVSFFMRPFSLGLRLFVAMTAGHILMKVLAGFVISGINLGSPGLTPIIVIPSFALMIGITLLELLVCAIQAYVFALLTSVYLNDAVNLH